MAAPGQGQHYHVCVQLSCNTACCACRRWCASSARSAARGCTGARPAGRSGAPASTAAREYPATWCHFGCAVQARPLARLALICLS